MLGEVESHALLYLRLQLLHVLPVILRENELPYALPLRSHRLLLYSTYRAHPPRQRDLPSHCDFPNCTSIDGKRNKRRGDGDSRRRPVFANLYLWEVEVNVIGFEIVVAEEGGSDVFCIGVGQLTGLLHYVVDVSSDQ